MGKSGKQRTNTPRRARGSSSSSNVVLPEVALSLGQLSPQGVEEIVNGVDYDETEAGEPDLVFENSTTNQRPSGVEPSSLNDSNVDPDSPAYQPTSPLPVVWSDDEEILGSDSAESGDESVQSVHTSYSTDTVDNVFVSSP